MNAKLKFLFQITKTPLNVKDHLQRCFSWEAIFI